MATFWKPVKSFQFCIEKDIIIKITSGAEYFKTSLNLFSKTFLSRVYNNINDAKSIPAVYFDLGSGENTQCQSIHVAISKI